jgi:predicted transposase YbfD/YdcC
MNIHTLVENVQNLKDPRRPYGYFQHKLESIVVISLCATISGAEDFEDIEQFGNARRDWLETFLDLSNGIPGKDTFRRLFERLDPAGLATCLYTWLEQRDCAGKTVNIDGKTMRGSGNTLHKAYHVVTAWVSENHITLGEIVVDEKSNEITAIPVLLDTLDIEGAVVTADALACQTDIARKIVDKKAGYCLALKGNQGSLHDDVRLYFENEKVSNTFTTLEKDHGRVETREYALETDIGWLAPKPDWAGLAGIGSVRSNVFEKGVTREETRYFITTLTDVKRFAVSVRKHWGIENNLHWQLDVTFGEDGARQRKDNSPLNWNVMRKTALPLLRNAPIGKNTSIKRKMFMAALNVAVLDKILFQGEVKK